MNTVNIGVSYINSHAYYQAAKFYSLGCENNY